VKSRPQAADLTRAPESEPRRRQIEGAHAFDNLVLVRPRHDAARASLIDLRQRGALADPPVESGLMRDAPVESNSAGAAQGVDDDVVPLRGEEVRWCPLLRRR
jgi:hypothetical protein